VKVDVPGRSRDDRQVDDDLGGDPACWSGVVVDLRQPRRRRPGYPDLTTRVRVSDLVTDFYRQVAGDDVLGPYFNDVAQVDWAAHIPHLTDYWCRILFGSPGFEGAVTKVHRDLHGLSPVTVEACDRWFELWDAALDARWDGPYADHARRHAATLMTGLARTVFDVDWTPSA
jgi:hemoglobin